MFDRHAVGQPDAPAEEHHRDVVRHEVTLRAGPSTAVTAATTRLTLHAAKGKDPLPFEKEVALLGKEHAEARQVHLLLIFLNLRKVGVVGEIRREPFRQPTFTSKPASRSGSLVATSTGHNVVTPPMPYGFTFERNHDLYGPIHARSRAVRASQTVFQSRFMSRSSVM